MVQDSPARLLLDAAELLVSVQGPRGLSMRAVADEVGTTTRAIYSLFGSKEGLIAALGVRAFDLLGAAVNAVPVTDDPAADLVEAGAGAFSSTLHGASRPVQTRRAAGRRHAQLVEIRIAANRAWVALQTRVERLQRDRRQACVDVQEAVKAFHALCEGLAALELRGFVSGEGEWRMALTALVNGLGSGAVSKAI